ncbi:MAG: hypothetical protein ACYS76_06985 [Planctomycetota bacterium]
MKSFISKLGVFFTLGLMVLWCSCTSTERPAAGRAQEPTVIEPESPEARPAETRPGRPEPPAAAGDAESPDVVAEVGDYAITEQELESRLINELRAFPEGYGTFDPADTRTVLMKILGEKAMILEARNQDLLKGDSSFRRFYEGRLVSSLIRTELQDKIRVTDSEIEQRLKTNPKWNHERAKAVIENEKARKLVDQFYEGICRKRHVRKLRGVFPKVVQIHNRLLYRPQEPRRGAWIMNRQIREELTPEEKSMVLATYDDGKITLLNWFEALNEMSPPSRPKDLSTIRGVERLLDRAMRTPIFLAEAKGRGLDKDENFVREVRAREDRMLLARFRSREFKKVKKPTDEEIVDYFNKHKEDFKSPDRLRIDQIWCSDLGTARKVKQQLRAGGDFESVKQQHSLKKEEKPRGASAASEGASQTRLWVRSRASTVKAADGTSAGR